MNKINFLNLMRFSKDWKEMYSDELYNLQINSYEPGDEDSSEHFRFGAFVWWLNANPSDVQIMKIKDLAMQDEEWGVCVEVLNCIRDIENAKITANIFYKLMSAGKYSYIYEYISTQIKEKITEGRLSDILSKTRSEFGKYRKINLISCKLKNFPTKNNSDINLTYGIEYRHGKNIEKILLDKENEILRISGYKVQPENGCPVLVLRSIPEG